MIAMTLTSFHPSLPLSPQIKIKNKINRGPPFVVVAFFYSPPSPSLTYQRLNSNHSLLYHVLHPATTSLLHILLLLLLPLFTHITSLFIRFTTAHSSSHQHPSSFSHLHSTHNQHENNHFFNINEIHHIVIIQSWYRFNCNRSIDV